MVRTESLQLKTCRQIYLDVFQKLDLRTSQSVDLACSPSDLITIWYRHLATGEILVITLNL